MRDLRGRALVVVIACLMCQLGLGFGYVFGPLARDIIAEFDWTRAQYAGARAPQLFLIAAASPVIGILSARVGARLVLMVSALMLGTVFIAFSWLQSLWQLYVIVAVMGLAIAGLGDISVGQLVNQWVVRGRGLALGIVYTGSNLAGWLLVPQVVAYSQSDGWRAALFWMGIGAFVVILPAATWAVQERPDAGIHGDHPAVQSDATDEDLDLRGALGTRTFWILAFCIFSFFFYFLGMLEHLVLFLTDEGMPLSEATGWFATAIGLGLVSKVGLGLLSDFMPKRTAILIDYGLLALSSLLVLRLPEPMLLWPFVLSYGFATAARDVVYPLIINHCFGTRYMAEIYGGLMVALIPGGVAGPVFAASVHDTSGSYHLAFITFIALNVAAVLALCAVRDERDRRREAT